MTASAPWTRRLLLPGLLGMALLAGCHHSSSTTTTYTVYVDVVGLAGTGLVLQNNAGNNLGVTGNGSTQFSNNLANGATYSVTVLTQPSEPAQVCSVIQGVGVIEGYNVAVEVSCGTVGTAVGRFAYVANHGSGTVSGYAINATTGALTQVTGSPFTMSGAVSLSQAVVDPTGSYLFVLDTGGNRVYSSLINQNTGALTAVSGSPFATGRTPDSLAFDYAGGFLYVANYADNTISAYSLTFASGALVPLTGSPFAVPGTNPGPIQLARSGDYLFVANQNASTVAVYAITAGTGVLAQTVAGSPFATDAGPHSITIDPSGKVLYTANAGAGAAGSISAFTLDLSSGTMAPVAGSPLAIPVVNNISIDAKSSYLFVTEAGGIAVYPIVNTFSGLLGAPVSGSPFAAGANPYSVVTDQLDLFAWVGNDGSASVSQYAFSATTGALTPVSGAPSVAAGNNPDSVVVQ